jgi:virginiamycin B lyase
MIGRITTGGSITQFSVPTAGSVPGGITSGPDGALWFGESGVPGSGPSQNQFERITTSGSLTEYPIPIPTPTSDGALPVPYAAAAGPDGNLWYTVATYVYFTPYYTPLGGLIARVTPAGAVTEYRLPINAETTPTWIAAGPDGALWFVILNEAATSIGNAIGRITTSGGITEYPIVDSMNSPGTITRGPDDALWFTDTGGCIDRMSTSGVTTYYAIPTPSGMPYGIVTGPDGALWFTEPVSGKIGRLVPN